MAKKSAKLYGMLITPISSALLLFALVDGWDAFFYFRMQI